MSTPPETIRRNMGDALPAIVYSATPDLRLDFANRHAADYFGVTEEEVAGHRWLDLVHPDDMASVLAAWNAARATGRYWHEHRLRLAGGHYERFRAEALPLRDAGGQILKWYGVLTPIGVETPRIRRPRDRPARVDYYPIRDAGGELVLLKLTSWTEQPDDPAAKQHPLGGVWYRIQPIE